MKHSIYKERSAPQARATHKNPVIQAAIVFSGFFMAAASATEIPFPTGPTETTNKYTFLIKVEGNITTQQLFKIRKIIQDNEERHLNPQYLVSFNSLGGDAIAGMQMGLLLRSKNAYTFVDQKCASACLFAFMGGALRFAPNNSLGLHKPRVEHLKTDQEDSCSDDCLNTKSARALQTRGEQLLSTYYQELGINEHLKNAIRDLGEEQIIWVSQQQYGEYGMITIAPSYLEEQKNTGALKDPRKKQEVQWTALQTQSIYLDCSEKYKTIVQLMRCTGQRINRN